MKAKILVIDDSEELCELIKFHLGSDFDLTVVYDGANALSALRAQVFDVILVDLALPDISGFEICSVIHTSETSKDSYVVVMSAREDTKAKVTAYNLGAVNYLEKPLNSEILKALMHSFERLKSKNFEVIQKVGDVEIDVLRQVIIVNAEEARLTTSEIKILSFLSERVSTTVSRSKILKLIAPEGKEVTERLVDTHVSSLRKKIRNSRLSIESIYKEGYVLRVHPA